MEPDRRSPSTRAAVFCRLSLRQLTGGKAASPGRPRDWQLDTAPDSKRRDIVIIITAGETVEEYLRQREAIAVIRPEKCGACGSTGLWHGNGWYPRGIVWIGGTAQTVDIRRLECQECGRTTSLLPDFLHRYRHYGLEVIEQVVSARVDEGVSWSAMAQRYSRDGVPSLRTMRRWYSALVQQALVWLTALLRALALVLPLLEALDPHTTSLAEARQVLVLGRHFAHWLEQNNTNWWQVMWRWGWNAGLGRLV